MSHVSKHLNRLVKVEETSVRVCAAWVGVTILKVSFKVCYSVPISWEQFLASLPLA